MRKTVLLIQEKSQLVINFNDQLMGIFTKSLGGPQYELILTNYVHMTCMFQLAEKCENRNSFFTHALHQWCIEMRLLCSCMYKQNSYLKYTHFSKTLVSLYTIVNSYAIKKLKD